MNVYGNCYSYGTQTCAGNGWYGGYDPGAYATGNTAYVYPMASTVQVTLQTVVSQITAQVIDYYGYGTTAGNSITFNSWGTVKEETKQERVTRKLKERQYRREEAARKARATEALVSVLNEKQREQFTKDRHFELQVNAKLYRIRPGSRVERLDPKTKAVQSYFCIHPPTEHGLPAEDVAIAQKLHLESDETSFLKIANESRAA